MKGIEAEYSGSNMIYGMFWEVWEGAVVKALLSSGRRHSLVLLSASRCEPADLRGNCDRVGTKLFNTERGFHWDKI
jgi:hypothetical protein